MLYGPLALLFAIWAIMSGASGWATAGDMAYWIILGAMLLGRWLEFRGGNPQTSTGEPATPGHLRRYVVLTLLLGLSVWVMANWVGNYWLAG
jgi:hypothetical protein